MAEEVVCQNWFFLLMPILFFSALVLFLSFFLSTWCVCVCAHILLLLIGFLMDQSRGSVSSVDQVSECCEVRKLGCQV